MTAGLEHHGFKWCHPDVLQAKVGDVVEDIIAYSERVKATLLVVGSMALAGQGSVTTVGSVTLSLARETALPVLVVKVTKDDAAITNPVCFGGGGRGLNCICSTIQL